MMLESDLMWSYSLFPEWWRQGEESGRLRIFFFLKFFIVMVMRQFQREAHLPKRDLTRNLQSVGMLGI